MHSDVVVQCCVCARACVYKVESNVLKVKMERRVLAESAIFHKGGARRGESDVRCTVASALSLSSLPLLEHGKYLIQLFEIRNTRANAAPRGEKMFSRRQYSMGFVICGEYCTRV